MKNPYKMLSGIMSVVCLCLLAAGCGDKEDIVEVKTARYQYLIGARYTEEAEANTVYTIRSQAEFDKYLKGFDKNPESLLTDIDFSEYALLFVWSVASHGCSVESKLNKKNGRYILSVEVDGTGNQPQVPTTWAVAVLVKNFPENTNVDLDVKTYGLMQ